MHWINFYPAENAIVSPNAYSLHCDLSGGQRYPIIIKMIIIMIIIIIIIMIIIIIIITIFFILIMLILLNFKNNMYMIYRNI